MRIIISPAKQMRVDTDSFACKEFPVFMDRSEVLMKWIRSLSYEEQKNFLYEAIFRPEGVEPPDKSIIEDARKTPADGVVRGCITIYHDDHGWTYAPEK